MTCNCEDMKEYRNYVESINWETISKEYIGIKHTKLPSINQVLPEELLYSTKKRFFHFIGQFISDPICHQEAPEL